MKVLGTVVTVWRLIARYPALSAGLFQVIILVGAQFGLHMTTAQLTSVAGTIAAIFGLLVHMGVIPVTKVANVRAGIKPTVPSDVAVAVPEISAKPADYPPTVPVQVVPGAITTIEAKRD